MHLIWANSLNLATLPTIAIQLLQDHFLPNWFKIAPLSNIKFWSILGPVFELPLVSHWSIALILRQRHTALIVIVLWYIFKINTPLFFLQGVGRRRDIGFRGLGSSSSTVHNTLCYVSEESRFTSLFRSTSTFPHWNLLLPP